MAIFITIIGFGIMILLHELGHFIVAKHFGVLVHEFSIGMGPKLFSVQKNETRYSIRLLPIGGFVKLEGENETEESDNPRSFSNLAPIKRILILLAGAVMNVLLGYIIFIIINSSTVIYPSVIDKIPDEYAQNNEIFMPGDEIIRLDNKRMRTADDVTLFMSRCDGEFSITLRRNGKIREIESFQAYSTPQGYKLGIVFRPEKASFIKNVRFAIYDTAHITKAVFYALTDLITGKVGMNALSGPVEIVSVVGTVTAQKNDYMLLSILYLFAMITVNLGIFNLLPFPALDGGSIVFALYELITRKKAKSEVVGYASLIGFAFLMVLAVVVTAGDIIDLFK